MVAQPSPTKAPANIEEFLWNIHSTLVSAAPGPLKLDNLKEQYFEHLGHKCAIERFLVVGEGGLAATLKRIPHVVSIFADSSGTTCVKATQKADITQEQLIEADKQYRREIMKKNAAKAAAMGSSKAKAPAAPAAPAGAPAKAAPTEGKRPLEAGAGPDAKKPRSDNDAETLARMLVQGVVRVLQNRVKADKGALPISELEDEFKALWKVPFNLAQAGETDAVSFLQKWPSKVEVIQEGDVTLVQLSKKATEKAKAGEPAAKATGATTAVKAGAIAKVPPAGAATAAKSPPPAAPPAKAVSAPAVPPASKAPEAAAKNGPSIPKRAGGPTRPPASIEDFLWNIHTVIEAYGGPMPLDQLKEAYSKHLGHKCAIERFLVVGEGGMAATLKRIPHIVSIVQDAGGELTLKAALGPGATKESLVAADHQYRKQLQQKNAAKAAPGAAAPAAPAAAKSPAAAPAEGERDPKKSRTEDPETLARMLVQGVVRVLQNRQKDGKGPLPVNDLESEFKALWKVPFNLQQAGETDAVAFLQKWPTKVEVLQEGGQTVVQLAKKPSEKATASKAPPAKTGGPLSSTASAVSSTAPVAAPASTAPPRPKEASAAEPAPEPAAANGAAAAQILQNLPQLQQQAVSMLQAMREMMQKQEAIVKALSQLNPDAPA